MCVECSAEIGGELTSPTIMREGNSHRSLFMGRLVAVHCASNGTVSIRIGLPGDLVERTDDSNGPI